METTPVLALQDFSETFEIEIDACDIEIGVILSQKGHPIAFTPKLLVLPTGNLQFMKRNF